MFLMESFEGYHMALFIATTLVGTIVGTGASHYAKKFFGKEDLIIKKIDENRLAIDRDFEQLDKKVDSGFSAVREELNKVNFGRGLNKNEIDTLKSLYDKLEDRVQSLEKWTREAGSKVVKP